VLLPVDTYRKSIASITAILRPFVPYLLTLPRKKKHVTILFLKPFGSGWFDNAD
jgi:hypothetical protein